MPLFFFMYSLLPWEKVAEGQMRGAFAIATRS